MMHFKHTFLSCSIVIALFHLMVSCKSDKPDVIEEKPVTTTLHSVYITNEGNFQFGNASVSYYSPANNTVVEDVFKANNQIALGDVCQSMNYFNGNFYIIVNNSHKIVVVNSATFQIVTQITGLNSPRYILPINAQKAYITDLYDNKISILDLNSNIIIGHILCNGWTEAIAMTSGKVLISNMYREKLYVVNPQNDIITDSISVPLGGNSMIVDKMGKVWLLCSGSSSQTGALCQVDVSSNSVIHNYPFNLGTNPIKLTTNASKDTLYWINDNVYRMAISDVLVPVSPFISLTGVNLYGLGVDPYTNEIYLSDAIDYVQKGMVYRYHSNGVLMHTFRVGVIPGDFYFK